MSETHDFKNPWLLPLYNFFDASRTFTTRSSARLGIVQLCRELWSDRSPAETLFMLQDVCAEASKRIRNSGGAAYAQRIHQNKLDRARELFLAIQSSDDWEEFSARASDVADDVVLLDEFLGADKAEAKAAAELCETTLDGVRSFLASVQSDCDLPVELKEIVVGQLGLLERSIGRFDVMGVTSFQEVIELSYGKLSLAMNCSDEPKTLKRMGEILSFLLKIHSMASMAIDGVKLLDHIRIRALPPPSDGGSDRP